MQLCSNRYKFSPPKEKGSRVKDALKNKAVETASVALSNSSVSQEPVLANADSGATGTYLRLSDIKVLRDVKMSTNYGCGGRENIDPINALWFS